MIMHNVLFTKMEHKTSQALHSLAGRADLLLFIRIPALMTGVFCRIFRRRPHGDDVRSILVLRLDGLGDCVLSLPMLKALKQCYPDARLTVVIQPQAQFVMASSPYVDEPLVLPPSESYWAPANFANLFAALRFYWSKLRRRSFDLVIQPRLDADLHHATLLCALTRAPRTVGFTDRISPTKRIWNGGFAKTFNVLIQKPPLQHEVLNNLEVIRALGYEIIPTPPQINIRPELRKWAELWLGDVRHGSSRLGITLPAAAAKRRWPIQKYLNLLEQLYEQFDFDLVLFSDPDTLPIANQLAKTFPNAKIVEAMELAQVASILALCNVVLCTDSGLAHISAAVNCHTVVISPHSLEADPAHPNSPLRFQPYSKKTVVLRPRLAREGCETGCEDNEPHCILDINQGYATNTLLRLLHEAQSG